MPAAGFKSTLLICLAIGLGMLMSARVSSGETHYDGRYQMHLNDVNGYNYMLDTATGDTWIMYNMMRLGRPVSVWLPTLRTNTFAESDQLMNSAQTKALEPLKK